MLAFLHNALGAGLLVAGPVVALMLFLSRRRMLNFGLRMSRALLVGGYLAAMWFYIVFLVGLPEGWRGRFLVVLAVPAMLLGVPTACVELRERLLERAWVRRWLWFEGGGSARWVGPHAVKAFRLRLFSRRPHPARGYVNE